TRFVAADVNATTFSSPLSAAPVLAPFPCVPAEDTLTRVYCCASAGPAIPSATARPHVSGSNRARESRRRPLISRVNCLDTGPSRLQESDCQLATINCVKGAPPETSYD